MASGRALTTVAVFAPGGGKMIINKSDFDPKEHKEYREKGISDLKVDELRALADEKKIDHTGMKKADLIEALS